VSEARLLVIESVHYQTVCSPPAMVEWVVMLLTAGDRGGGEGATVGKGGGRNVIICHRRCSNIGSTRAQLVRSGPACRHWIVVRDN
jgi:hypothetical protein